MIENLKIQNWPVHGFAVEGSSDLTIRNIMMDNRAGDAPNSISLGKNAAHNSDGFGVKSSSNILIENCIVYNQDDCVAVTSGDNITASGMFCSGTHGLSIGSIGGKSNNNVTNVLVSVFSLPRPFPSNAVSSHPITSPHFINPSRLTLPIHLILIHLSDSILTHPAPSIAFITPHTCQLNQPT